MIFSKQNKISQHAYAVVTGAGSGIGQAFALALAKRGSHVVCADINLSAAQATQKMIQARYATPAYALLCDVSQAAVMERLAQEAKQVLGQPVNLLINNAGVGIGGKFHDMSLEDWHWCLNINLWGVIHGCHYFVEQLKQHPQAAILNVASAAGFTAAPEMSVYNVSKSAVLALSETLAAELKPYQIAVHVLCPTLVATNIMNNARLPQQYSAWARRLIQKRAMLSTEAVVERTLNRLDAGKLYSLPQNDAKLFWGLKRFFPQTYNNLLGSGYPLFQKIFK